MAVPRILVIDDDVSVRPMLFRCLQRVGYQCISASSGAQGIALASQRNPDLILLDLRLPDMMGFSVLKQLRQDGRTASIPVITITAELNASDLLGDAAACFQVQGFLQKPVALDVLLRTIAQALGDKAGAAAADPWLIKRGPLQIDLKKRVVLVNGKSLRLGHRRFDTLCALARSKDGVPTKILSALVWGGEDGPINTTAKTVNRLRRDLEQACGQDLIVPIPGGYKLQ